MTEKVDSTDPVNITNTEMDVAFDLFSDLETEESIASDFEDMTDEIKKAHQHEDEETFTDNFYILLLSNGINITHLQNIHSYWNENEYDSDAIAADLHMNKENNLSKFITNKEDIIIINDCFIGR
eukprot:108088_1